MNHIHFFGGTPESFTKSLKKFTFNNKTANISKIEIIFNNSKTFEINIEEKNKRYIFDEEYGYMIGLPKNIYYIFYNILFNQYKYKEKQIHKGFYETYDVYELNEEQIKEFPILLFTIGNKVLILNKNILTENNYLYIGKLEHENDFYFGQKFFELP